MTCWGTCVRGPGQPGLGLERLCRVVVGALICAAVLGGCRGFTQRLIPDRIDFVGKVTPISASGPATATLKSGETISIDPATTLVVAGALDPGDLLIRGSQPRAWLMTVAPDPSCGCFWIAGWGTEDGASIMLDSGPVLPKSPNFDRSTVATDDPRFERSGFCLNDQGQMTAVQL